MDCVDMPGRWKTLKIFLSACAVMFVLFVGAVFCFPGTQGRFFFDGTGDFMMDYYNHIIYAENNDPYRHELNPSFDKPYPAAVYVALRLSGVFVSNLAEPTLNLPTLAAIFCMVIFSSLLVMLIFATLEADNFLKTCFVLCFLTSGMFLWTLERGNYIFLTVSGVFFYLFNYRSKNPALKEAALLALACAAATKASPAVFGLLLLQEKDYRSAARLVIYGLIMVFGPFLLLKGGLSDIPLWLTGMHENSMAYMLREISFGPYRGGLSLVQTLEMYDIFMPLDAGILIMHWITVFCVILLAFLSFREKVLWRRALVLTLVVILLPGNSSFYTALYFLPVMVAFFNAGERFGSVWVYVAAFVLLFAMLQICAGPVFRFEHLRDGAVWLLLIAALYDAGRNYSRAGASPPPPQS